MRDAKFVGLVHKSGEFNGKPYSVYQAFFVVDPLPDTIGLNILTARLDSPFPELCKDNLNRIFTIYDYFNNNRCQVAGVQLKG